MTGGPNPSSLRPAGSGIVALKLVGVTDSREDERAHSAAMASMRIIEAAATAIHQRSRPARAPGPGEADRAASSGASLPASTSSMTSRASPTSRSRSFASRARQRRSSPRMRGGVAAGSVAHPGSALSTAASTSLTVSPSKSLSPVSISHSTTPKAQMSARLSTGLPLACSGAM